MTEPKQPQTKHTPLPWKTDIRENGWFDNSIIDESGECVAVAQVMNCDYGTLPTARANAAFIVKAVNNHEKLLEMVKTLLAIDTHRPDFSVSNFSDEEKRRIVADWILEGIRAKEKANALLKEIEGN
jgi:hypothetical protein